MMRALEKRVRKLETQVPPQQTPEDKLGSYFRDFLLCGLAHYFGDPDPEDSLASAWARALGYTGSGELARALEPVSSDYLERYALAVGKLLTKFGTGPHDTSNETLERIGAGLSERCKKLLRDEARELAIGGALWVDPL